MFKYHMFSIKFGDYSHKTVDIDGVFRNYYDQWFNSHVGQWTKEKNIKLLQGEMYRDEACAYSVYPFYIVLTNEQNKEYQEILFYEKLTRL